MILIITHKLDFTADFLINKLNDRKIEYRRLNCEDILSTNYSFEYHPDMTFSIMGVPKYTSVWFRRTLLPDLDIELPQERKYILGEVEAFMKNIFSILDAKWVSPPREVYHAENKLYQLKLAKKLGFKIPETLVTSDKEELKNFFGKHDHIIVKPIFQTRISSPENAEFIFTNRVTKEQIDSLNSFDLSPCIFQREIEKTVELRITVVNGQTFAAQVKSQEDEETKTDWRKKKLAFTIFELPSHIHQLCIDLVREMGLVFGAIDMILSPDGTYTFLEINPNGQWVWIETETGLKISDAIIKELL
ncbi:hypothetical protein [Pedobacter sp. Hv1]|uniref:hypothetical protein n=1 Tax=Pedobacter sp. Hv1 TaxID=1740090 RepID=UPI0006D8A787|nr:hypothetical protein [Pedobacter sp. Hv1]KQC00389.1 hypothetical protein AQF98_12960 [Pedobacter sp. Hv1]